MNNQLIPVFAGEISGLPVNLVDARILHSFLDVARDFSTWIKDRIEEYSFIENIDFLLPKFGEQKKRRGGNNRIDYHLTLDMAKELAMVERNEKGRQARRYFIECEQRAMNSLPQNAGQLTLADIERLIEQKLNARAPELPKPKSIYDKPCNTISSGIRYPEPAEGYMRTIVDTSIAQLSRQLEDVGYRIVRI